jgi:hypothetical protein
VAQKFELISNDVAAVDEKLVALADLSAWSSSQVTTSGVSVSDKKILFDSRSHSNDFGIYNTKARAFFQICM